MLGHVGGWKEDAWSRRGLLGHVVVAWSSQKERRVGHVGLVTSRALALQAVQRRSEKRRGEEEEAEGEEGEGDGEGESQGEGEGEVEEGGGGGEGERKKEEGRKKMEGGRGGWVGHAGLVTSRELTLQAV